MNRRTARAQRKVRIPTGFKKKAKKAKTEKAIETNAEPSCEITGCGCGK